MKIQKTPKTTKAPTTMNVLKALFSDLEACTMESIGNTTENPIKSIKETKREALYNHDLSFANPDIYC